MVERINYQGLPSIAGPYVHATKHNGTLYVSGLTAYGTSSQDQGIGEQTNEILSQIKQILEHEQRAVSDLIKLTIFICDMSELGSLRELLFDFYGEYLPACSLVEVSKLIHPDLKVEIEITAAL